MGESEADSPLKTFHHTRDTLDEDKTMKSKLYGSTSNSHPARSRVAFLLVALLAFSSFAVFACQAAPKATPTPEPTPTAQPTPAAQPASTAQDAQDAPPIPGDQLESLVAPIALYPDPLLTQMLVASTYPLEIVQLQQWLAKKGGVMNEKAITDAVKKQAWDPILRAKAVLPDG